MFKLENAISYTNLIIDHIKDQWKRYLKYISFGLFVLSYLYVIYWIDSVESVRLVISWFPY